MSNYFWGMTKILKETLLFKNDDFWFSVFLWAFFPITIATWTGWVLGDINGSNQTT